MCTVQQRKVNLFFFRSYWPENKNINNPHISPKFIKKKMSFLQRIQEIPRKKSVSILDFKSTQSRFSKFSAVTYQAVYWVGHGCIYLASKEMFQMFRFQFSTNLHCNEAQVKQPNIFLYEIGHFPITLPHFVYKLSEQMAFSNWSNYIMIRMPKLFQYWVQN